ncbi:hypothetical protein L198_06660 [Cryptococcus wingfieldii CBS 7118]|uniref:Velvet domain-containing protein n=1 Tax=Cryptococcus wingfieldii CBS 7118 TaxID=1295528 RepID=A0A1E3IIG9_9TREE|nr:hypothetical protein L198_06660 [Cryptococcus wingfieldii CBS 7118]ODN88389.1 hypothetical protein L198_06660 [Cryptococcus wingfieldii CBS 7118]
MINNSRRSKSQITRATPSNSSTNPFPHIHPPPQGRVPIYDPQDIYGAYPQPAYHPYQVPYPPQYQGQQGAIHPPRHDRNRPQGPPVPLEPPREETPTYPVISTSMFSTSLNAAQPPPPPAGPVSNNNPGETYLSGFQVDYPRVEAGRAVRRPRVVVEEDEKDEGSGVRKVLVGRRKVVVKPGVGLDGLDGDDVGEVFPPPAEAYIILRPHRVPRELWDDGVFGDFSDAEDCPSRGKALGLQAQPRGFPALNAPLIVQLTVYDSQGHVVPVDSPVLSRRLVHTIMVVDLVSPDGKEQRSSIKLKPNNDLLNSSSPESSPAPPIYRRNLLGATVRASSVLSRGGGRHPERGIFFVFSELVVRNFGVFALRMRVADLAGPAHLGTSIGVTRTLVEGLTPPFEVL